MTKEGAVLIDPTIVFAFSVLCTSFLTNNLANCQPLKYSSFGANGMVRAYMRSIKIKQLETKILLVLIYLHIQTMTLNANEDNIKLFVFYCISLCEF